MSENLYYQMLATLEAAVPRHRTLFRLFYKFGNRVHRLCTDEEAEFVSGITFSPSGNFVVNDGSIENTDELLIPAFTLEFLDYQYQFRFSTVGAGMDTVLHGCISISVHTQESPEHQLEEIARVIYDREGKVLKGPSLVRQGNEYVGGEEYCRSLIPQLLFDHAIALRQS